MERASADHGNRAVRKELAPSLPPSRAKSTHRDGDIISQGKSQPFDHSADFSGTALSEEMWRPALLFPREYPNVSGVGTIDS
jgi:hypothetical protein